MKKIIFDDIYFFRLIRASLLCQKNPNVLFDCDNSVFIYFLLTERLVFWCDSCRKHLHKVSLVLELNDRLEDQSPATHSQQAAGVLAVCKHSACRGEEDGVTAGIR